MATPTDAGKQRPPIVLMLVCACVVIAFCAVRVIPAWRRLRHLEKDIAAARLQLEEQRILLPVYTKLLPLVVPRQDNERTTDASRLAQNKIPALQTQLGKLATAMGLRSLAVAPRAESLVSGEKRLEVEWRLAGPITSLRGVLAELAQLDFVEHLGHVRVQRVEHDVEYHLGVWVALE